MKTAMVVAILVLFAVPAVAVTYQWEDSQGTINFTEDLGSIPKQYRNKAKVLGAEEEVTSGDSAEGSADAKPAPAVKVNGRNAGQAASDKKEEEKTYGGKSPESWQREFTELDRKIKYDEEQLDDLNARMKDTSKMSRGEYLSIQLGIKETETRLQRLRGKLESLTSEANRAGVPAALRSP